MKTPAATRALERALRPRTGITCASRSTDRYGEQRDDQDRAQRGIGAGGHGVDLCGERLRFLVGEGRDTIPGAGGVDAERLQPARDIAAAEEIEQRRAIGLRCGRHHLIGADHSGLRELVRCPDHQHYQQAADRSCPDGFHVPS